uniref:CCHC-type domain-containing protein n=1 Tax=Tanacetum cinerariifolium TaxID=118510 RepID=A0A699I5R8_TANCI|nr:hypothetical protein [Tanacetum cinerariifolium]
MIIENVNNNVGELVEFRFCINSKKTQSFLLVVLDLIQDSLSPQVVSAAKLPILNPNEFDLWKIRIKQYFLMIDYSLWEVIMNGDSPVPTRVIEGVIQPVAPISAEQRLARKNELKARDTLLMDLPDKHQLKFNSHKDAKTLMEAIEKIFKGNIETKKVQKTLLKQQFKNFTGSSSKSLDQIHDKLQKLVSQLEIHRVSLSQEDVNLKFLRSLPSKWKTHTLIWGNKADLEEQSLDDFQSTSPRLDNKDLKQIDVDDLEEMDLRWQMAMLTIRARRFLQKTGRNIGANGATSMGFNMSKVECYNCHRKGHFAKECRSPKDSRRTGAYEPQRRTIPSYQAEEEPANYALMAFSSSSSSFDNESTEHVKYLRHSVQPFNTSILAATPALASLKSTSSGKRRNRKACFVCKSVDHLIKDCDYHIKKIAQPVLWNYTHRGNNKQHAPLTHKSPSVHTAPTAVLTQSKPVFNTVVRPVSAAIPNINVTQPIYAHQVVTKSKSPIRRHITRSPSSKTSNSPPRVTAVKAPVVSAAQGMQGKWVWRPKCPIIDHDSQTTGNMSYLSDFKELNGRYVAFGGNPKGGKISGKGKIKTVLLRVPREKNMYNVNLKNIVPYGDLTCLFAKATIDESNLWHRRLAYINFKTINKLVNGNLVRGLPTKVFENDNTCVAHKKGKQHRASCKTKHVSSVDQPLFRLHMDLFEPTFVKSLNKKSYCLVITDDYSRFTWVFFLVTMDETSPILKTFITGLENQLSLKVKQNGITERKNKTLIAAARTMLADSLLPISFWAEAVNTTCYVQNMVLVTKPHNKTPYELLHGKFEGKVDERFLVRYSVNSKAFRVFNSRTHIVQETLHVNFLENKPNIAGSGPTWLFDIDSLTRTMNYQPVITGNQTNPSAGFKDKFNAEKAGEEIDQQYEHDFDAKKPKSEVILSLSSSAQSRKQDDKTKKEAKGKSHVESFTGYRDLNSEFEDCSDNSSNKVNVAELEDITYSDDEDVVGAEADFNNLESTIPVSLIPTTRIYKDHLVS